MLTLALFYYMCWGCPKGRPIVAEALIFVGNTRTRTKRLCCLRAFGPTDSADPIRRFIRHLVCYRTA